MGKCRVFSVRTKASHLARYCVVLYDAVFQELFYNRRVKRFETKLVNWVIANTSVVSSKIIQRQAKRSTATTVCP